MLLNKFDVTTRLHISNRTLELWCSSGYFPRPTYFGRRAIWRAIDVDAWVAHRFTERKEGVV